MSKLHLEYLTENIVLKVVLLKEGHIAVAFATGISNQTPVSDGKRIKSSAKLHYITLKEHIFSLSLSTMSAFTLIRWRQNN